MPVRAAARVGLIDYGSGNLRSVAKALEASGADVKAVTERSTLGGLDAIVVPGQGAFHQCAAHLRASGLWDPVRDWVGGGRPYLGICLGYQLLFESSEESPGISGLGLLSGSVRRFKAEGLKIPHMGWDTLDETSGPLHQGLGAGTAMYFVHSYHPVPEDPSVVSAWCDYGGRFAAAISTGSLHAVQYHPEKSQAAGLAVLRNFLSVL